MTIRQCYLLLCIPLLLSIACTSESGTNGSADDADNNATRSIEQQYAECKDRMHTLEVACKAWQVDHNALPPFSMALYSVNFSVMRSDAENNVPSFSNHTLTTPVPYIGRLPDDPFAPHEQITFAYKYYGRGNSTVLIWSMGPDQDYDIDANNHELLFSKDLNDFNQLDWLTLHDVTYDPTNGLLSDGDIWQTSFTPKIR